MARLVSLTAGVLVAGLVAIGVAVSATIRGTEGPDRLRGTDVADALYGRGGNDRIEGAPGNDLVHGGPGADALFGNAGDDRIAVQVDGARDGVGCGPGHDAVTAELSDRIAADCEVVTRQLSRDISSDFRSQPETQVEPDSFSFGSTIVTAFQSGRYSTGGAALIGWSTSRDGGRTWRSGFLPALSQATTPPGPYARVSDPVVAYDAAHGVWLIASLALGDRDTALVISRSADGVRWNAPIVAARDPTEDYDKEWLTCDNWQGSRFRGRCYLSYLDFAGQRIATRSSTDGGRTWSQPAGSPGITTSGTIMNGVQPITRPDGTLLILVSVFGALANRDANQVAVIRSTDGGATFTAPARVATLFDEEIGGVRAPPFVSVETDARGRIFAAWQDCRFRDECTANDIVFSSSADGVTWSSPERIPVGPATGGVDYFLPGLAVDPLRSGAQARLALVYHVLTPARGCSVVSCPPATIDVYFVSSNDAGRSWTVPQRLTTESMPLHWIAETGIGRMLADYVSTSFASGRAIPVFAIASAPVAGEFRQAIYATTRVSPPSPTRRRVR